MFIIRRQTISTPLDITPPSLHRSTTMAMVTITIPAHMDTMTTPSMRKERDFMHTAPHLNFKPSEFFWQHSPPFSPLTCEVFLRFI